MALVRQRALLTIKVKRLAARFAPDDCPQSSGLIDSEINIGRDQPRYSFASEPRAIGLHGQHSMQANAPSAQLSNLGHQTPTALCNHTHIITAVFHSDQLTTHQPGHRSMEGSRATYALGGALVGASIATAAVLGYKACVPPCDEPSASQPQASTSRPAPTTGSVRRFAEDDIIAEQLTRNVQFFGAEGQQRIADAFVVVVGLGVSCHGVCRLLNFRRRRRGCWDRAAGAGGSPVARPPCCHCA